MESNGAASSSTNQIRLENHPITSLLTNAREGEVTDVVESGTTHPDSFDMTSLHNEIKSHHPDVSGEEKSIPKSSDISSSTAAYEGCSSMTIFSNPDEICIPHISASFIQLCRGGQKMMICHKDIALQLCCNRLKVRFGINARFFDSAGRPRLSFVVDAPASLYKVLDSCDDIARSLFLDSGSSSEWRRVVIRKEGFANYPTVRLQ